MKIMENLSRDEEFVTQAIVHWITLTPYVLLWVFCFLVAVGSENNWFAVLSFILVVGPAIIRKLTTELVLTNKRLCGKVGFINTKTLDTPLNKVNTVSISSGLFGKLFGYGTLHITSSSGAYDYKCVSQPKVFRDAVMDEIEKFDEARIKKQASEMAAAMKQ